MAIAVNNVTFEVRDSELNRLSVWAINTHMDTNPTNVEIYDIEGNPITPKSQTRTGTSYVITFDSPQSGKAILTY